MRTVRRAGGVRTLVKQIRPVAGLERDHFSRGGQESRFIDLGQPREVGCEANAASSMLRRPSRS